MIYIYIFETIKLIKIINEDFISLRFSPNSFRASPDPVRISPISLPASQHEGGVDDRTATGSILSVTNALCCISNRVIYIDIDYILHSYIYFLIKLHSITAFSPLYSSCLS